MSKRLLFSLPVILIIAALASGLTYLNLNPAIVSGLFAGFGVQDQSANDGEKAESTEVKEEVKQEEKPQEVQPVSQQAPDVKTAVVKNEVNLRSTMSTEAQILAVIPQGATVTLLAEESSAWQQISYQGITGYVSKTYLTY